MDIAHIAFLTTMVIFLLTVLVSFLMQEKIIRTLYRDYNEVWVKIGSPGSFAWRPPGRSWLENLKITHAFSYFLRDNLPIFYNKNDIIPDEIVRLCRLYLWTFVPYLISFLVTGVVFLKTLAEDL